jgi:hypothetical protein
VSPVKYKLGLYSPEDDILHSHRRENHRPYTLRSSLVMHYATSREVAVSFPDQVIGFSIDVILLDAP